MLKRWRGAIFLPSPLGSMLEASARVSAHLSHRARSSHARRRSRARASLSHFPEPALLGKGTFLTAASQLARCTRAGRMMSFVNVTLKVPYETKWGESLAGTQPRTRMFLSIADSGRPAVTGSSAALGNWEPSKARRMLYEPGLKVRHDASKCNLLIAVPVLGDYVPCIGRAGSGVQVHDN